MCIFFEILNNATVAAILAVFLGGFFAKFAYRQQKELDRWFDLKKEAINDIIFLQERAGYSLLIIDRVANTYKITDKTDTDFFKETIEKYELPKLADTINEEIPSGLLRITAKINIYFSKNKKIITQYEIFSLELKKWHDTVVNIKFDFRQSVKSQPSLSNDELNQETKKLIDIIWKEKIS
jgi:hypothetical protein